MHRSPIKRKTPLKRTGLKSKPKECRKCHQPRPLWKDKLCQKCHMVEQINSAVITKDKVDQVFSWLVRTLYPNFCHACKKPLPYKMLQCCHMVPKSKGSLLRYDIRNCYPGCEECNFYDETHELELAKQCDHYWGTGTSALLHTASERTYSRSKDELKELYSAFLAFLTEAEKPGANKNQIREEVMLKTSAVIKT